MEEDKDEEIEEDNEEEDKPEDEEENPVDIDEDFLAGDNREDIATVDDILGTGEILGDPDQISQDLIGLPGKESRESGSSEMSRLLGTSRETSERKTVGRTKKKKTTRAKRSDSNSPYLQRSKKPSYPYLEDKSLY